MKKLIILIVLAHYGAVYGQYHVNNQHPAASDSNPGTITQPFKTIQKCGEVAGPGDICEVHEGTYTDPINNQISSGTASNPITFRAYNNEQVYISGLQEIQGTWVDQGNNIWKIEANAGSELGMYWSMNDPTLDDSEVDKYGGNQIFVNDQLWYEARIPNLPSNIQVYEATRDHDFIATSGGMDDPTASSGTTQSGFFTHPDLATLNPSDWIGARLNSGLGVNWTPQTGFVTALSGDQVTFDFVFGNSNYIPQETNEFFLWGKLAGLDSEREWFYDEATQALYLYAPSGQDPNTWKVEAKKDERVVLINGPDYLIFDNIDVKGTTLWVDNPSEYITIQNTDFSYNGHGIYSPRIFSGKSHSIVFQGKHHQFLNNTIKYAAASAIRSFANSEDIKYEGNEIAYCGYFGRGGGIFVRGDDHRILNNTIHHLGHAEAISDASDGTIIKGNHVYETARHKTDDGAILIRVQEINPGVRSKTTIVTDNLVHDINGVKDPSLRYFGTAGIFADAAPNNLVIHHNVIYNTTSGGIKFFPCNLSSGCADDVNIKMLNNTIGQGVQDFGIRIVFPGSGHTHNGLEITNNLIYNSDFMMPLSSEITYNNNLFGDPYDYWVDPDNNDYNLKSNSPAIDTGMEFSPYTDGFNGIAPDIGGIESSSVLPVELLTFTVAANLAKQRVDLIWQTVSETNNYGFEIERSSDATRWTNIGFVKGNETTIEEQTYTFLDKNPTTGVNYYRLKQIDFDGQFSYSAIRSTTYIQHPDNTIKLYPNPFADQLIIRGSDVVWESISITNTLGQEKTNLVRFVQSSSSQITLETSRLQPGWYFVRVGNTAVQVFKR